MTNEMGETPDVRELQLRIVELENKLAQMSQQGQTANLTPAELQAYAKVRDMLAIDPACGINECSRYIALCFCGCRPPSSVRCFHMCYSCMRCIVECTCGPCNICDVGGGTISGGSRFGGLGG